MISTLHDYHVFNSLFILINSLYKYHAYECLSVAPLTNMD